jgi:hypothetical protein
MSGPYVCCDERRREAVRGQGALNGIDWLDVLDHDAPSEAERQRLLHVHFVNSPPPAGLTPAHVVITGGERIVGIEVVDVSYDGDVLVVRVDPPGDFSPYVLRLVEAGAPDTALAALDPLLAEVVFSFKVECPSDLDCRPRATCPPETDATPAIDYLAKDYQSIRRLLLDRLALLAPGWQERNAADLGVVLVELLAYVADHLSYEQDAVATEAYLGTARRRTSIRRHARLVDYLVDDGASARVWVQVTVGAPTVLPAGTAVLTQVAGMPPRLAPGSVEHVAALRAQPEVFETMHEAALVPAHERLTFYTWGGRECCIPRGATRATLRGHLTELEVGQVLVLTEVLGPHTGRPQDADPAHRYPVRLTRVSPTQDPLGGAFEEPPSPGPIDVTEIEWASGDALPFPLCVSAVTDEAHGGRAVDAVSVALGNIVLADHGRTIADEALGTVPAATRFRAPTAAASPCEHPVPSPIAPRVRPALAEGPLSRVAPAPDRSAAAAAALAWSAADVLPALRVRSVGTAVRDWTVRRDLIESGPLDADVVAETEDDGVAALRFGDDEYGMRPEDGAAVTATYRVGTGTAGNVGAGAIAHVVSPDAALAGVWNPLPGQGGVDPESLEHVRQSAPSAFRVQERAVTPADWAEVTQRDPGVQRAAATFRWTGSWHTVFDTVDRVDGLAVDATFRAALRDRLEGYRVVGRDLEIDAPRFVPLRLEMRVCVKPSYFRSDVEDALRALFSTRVQPDGRRGLFHPDAFTFGQPVYLSPLYAAAQGVDGVDSVEITKLERLFSPGKEALETGALPLGRLEVARLDDDPDFPERGVFGLTLGGGR